MRLDQGAAVLLALRHDALVAGLLGLRAAAADLLAALAELGRRLGVLGVSLALAGAHVRVAPHSFVCRAREFGLLLTNATNSAARRGGAPKPAEQLSLGFLLVSYGRSSRSVNLVLRPCRFCQGVLWFAPQTAHLVRKRAAQARRRSVQGCCIDSYLRERQST